MQSSALSEENYICATSTSNSSSQEVQGTGKRFIVDFLAEQ